MDSATEGLGLQGFTGSGFRALEILGVWEFRVWGFRGLGVSSLMSLLYATVGHASGWTLLPVLLGFKSRTAQAPKKMNFTSTDKAG